MNHYTLTQKEIEAFLMHLKLEEKSHATLEKYARDIKRFYTILASDDVVTKEVVLLWKESLIAHGYAIASINSMLAAVNSLFHFLNWHDCRVKQLKQQRKVFSRAEKELSKTEYLRLVETATRRNNHQLALLLETICATGIRVSEVAFITVKAVKHGYTTVSLKGKVRTIFLPKMLCNKLKKYATSKGISEGSIFCNRNGAPMTRHYIWAVMKRLCPHANVQASKVFPHNLRHLFARTFYKIKKDIAKLADLLGHSSIETTRLYIITSGNEHQKLINRLQLVV